MEEKEKAIKKAVGAEWIYQFKLLVDQLDHDHSVYKNVCVELELFGKINQSSTDKPGSYKGLEDLRDDQKNVFLTSLQKARYSLTRTYIKYKALLKKLELKESQDIETGYGITKDAIIEWEKLEALVITINVWLLDQTIDELMDKSMDIVSQIYQNATRPEQEEPPAPGPKHNN